MLNQPKVHVSSGCTVLIGDCLKVIPQRFALSKFDLIFVDPPYNIGQDYGDGKKADRLTDVEFRDWCWKWLYTCRNALAPTGSLWVLMGEEYTHTIGSLLAELGLHRRRLVVWYETFGVHCTQNFHRCSRFLHYCVKDPKHFTFNAEDPKLRVPSARQEVYNDKRANPAGKLPDSVWTFPRVCGTFKERVKGGPPNQLPLALCERVVRACTNPGDTVLDPMCGSGTMLRAALGLGRKAVGIEVRREFLPIIQERIKGVEPCRTKTSSDSP